VPRAQSPARPGPSMSGRRAGEPPATPR
jgi:hypothetical protein